MTRPPSHAVDLGYKRGRAEALAEVAAWHDMQAADCAATGCEENAATHAISAEEIRAGAARCDHPRWADIRARLAAESDGAAKGRAK